MPRLNSSPERRRWFLVLAACAAAMPLTMFGPQYLVFELFFPAPPRPLQYATFAVVLLCQWVCYFGGFFSLAKLNTSCPRPATPLRAWSTGIIAAAFLVAGALGCGLLTLLFLATTFLPWG